MVRAQQRLAAPWLAAILSTTATGALAQSADAPAKDNSGTNPAQLTRSFQFGADLRWLGNGRYFHQPNVRYTEPFANDRMSITLKAPLVSTNLDRGRALTGFGDLSAKWTWVAYIDPRQAIVPSFEVTAPTASERVTGAGRWTAAPGLTYAAFLSPEWIVAPAVVYVSSFGGERDRAHVSRLDTDLYAVYKPQGQRWWLTQDLTVSRDFIARKWPASYRVALGMNIGKLGDAAVNLAIRPGIGIGRDKPFRYSFEVNLSVVGF
jgi:hypothetical protein